MRIDYPRQEQLPQLQRLWKEAFRDTDATVDAFFHTAFAPDRCRCVTVDGRVAAALYWFDCRCYGKPIAYLYAVATERSFRRKGVCRKLMEDTRRLLTELGYWGILLVPGDKGLVRMYEGMGYQHCCGIGEFSCRQSGSSLPLRSVSGAEYARLRREKLPMGGVIQERENLSFLETQAELYAGDGFLVAVAKATNSFLALELLGDREAAGDILTTLGKKEGVFRTPGNDRYFTLYLSLQNLPMPEYFGLAFD